MGMCVSIENKVKKRWQTVKTSKFSKMELNLLQLIYENLSNRCRNHLVSRETFDVFFHANGLIGQILFQNFDADKNGTISFHQFLIAFQLMTKGTLRQRADVLFQIYDVGKTGGVKYEELLKILFSYAPEQLNKMFAQQNFLQYIGQNQLSYYFGAEDKRIEQKMIIQEVSEFQGSPRKDKNKFVAGSAMLIKMETELKQGSSSKIVPREVKNKLVDISNKQNFFFINSKNQSKKSNNRAASMAIINDANFVRKNLTVKSNIASLTKRYANFLFANYKLDKGHDSFSKQNFFQLLQEHTGLFNIYLSGFHLYAWQTNCNDEPEFKSLLSWVEGDAQEVFLQSQQSVYLKYIRTTIFVLNHKKAKVPREIINLQGLTVQNILQRQGKLAYGIKFKHRDGLYPAKQYYFSKKQQHAQWIKLLSEFMHSSLQDNYMKLQRIGSGNYSTVFRGKNKKTGQQVAIKVMQTFKLSLSEKQVLKREVGILKQCHHPNIIKFYEQYKTKTDLSIVTQICTQGDLFQYTKEQGYLQEYQAAIVFKQLVDAMLYLNNELGIVHRDLKPENVLIKMNTDKKIINRIKLIDFGFGVFKDKIKDLPLKEKFAGTQGFMAPEIYKLEEYDEKVDTFSLGIILYFMLSGNHPFASSFIEEIQALTKACSVQLDNNHWANISEEVKSLILKILCPKEVRISTKQVSQHPWLQNIDRLKTCTVKNQKKPKKIGLQF